MGIRIYSRHTEIFQRPVICDLYALAVPLFHTFGRIGCFLGGCCFGIEYSFGFSQDGISRFPVQLPEAALNLLLFCLLRTAYRNEFAKGHLLRLYLLIYPPIRFGLEFLRSDEIRGFFSVFLHHSGSACFYGVWLSHPREDNC